MKDAYRVEAIYVDGADVLRQASEEYAFDDDADIRYTERSPSGMEEKLSQELVVPSRLLNITYTPSAASKGPLKFPAGYTVRKG